MYADPRDLHDKEIKTRFSEEELRELNEAARLARMQRAVFIRELALAGARSLLESAKHKHEAA